MDLDYVVGFANREASRGTALYAGIFIGKYAPVEALAVARTLAESAVTAPSGITIIESDAIR